MMVAKNGAEPAQMGQFGLHGAGQGQVKLLGTGPFNFQGF